jgi:hypothetical protein
MNASPSIALEHLQQFSWFQLEKLLDLMFAFRSEDTAAHDAQQLLRFAQELVKRYDIEKSASIEWPSAETLGLESESKLGQLIRLLSDEKDKSDNPSKRFLLAAAHHFCQTSLPLRERTTWRTRTINAILNNHDVAISNVTLAIKPLLDQKLIRVLPGQETEKAEGKQVYHEILPVGLRRAAEIAAELENHSNHTHTLNSTGHT